MLSVHIITSLGPKGSLRWIGSCPPARPRWIYEALYHDEALVEHFVSLHLCLSVRITIASFLILSCSFTLSVFKLSIYLVCSDLWPLLYFLRLLLIGLRWSDVVWASESRVGGSKLSIKCFCRGPREDLILRGNKSNMYQEIQLSLCSKFEL